jgi:L-threonylcarbamoyladenylate synthase
LQNDKLNLAAEAINNNQVVGIPTETVYGIGVNPYSQEAVDKIFDLKGRDEDKPLSILVSSYYDLQKLDIVSTIPEVVELYWPGPLTIVVETTKEFADGVGTKNPFSIGVRVPDNELAIELLKITGPLAVTSANRSGENDITSNAEAEEIFGSNVAEYLEGAAVHASGSTIIDFRVEGGEILREGPLKWPPSYC